MSVYTTQIRFICEEKAGLKESVGYNDINTIIQKAIPKIFDFQYPIFDTTYKNLIETKILKHYYTREIGLETYGLWKLKLDTKLNEIMPYYNQLYESTLLSFNPLYDVDITRTHRAKVNGTEKLTGNAETDARINTEVNQTGSTKNDTSVTQNSTEDNTDKYSDTPQGSIQDLEAGTYLTNARIINDKNTTTGKTDSLTDVNNDTITDTTNNTTTNTNNNKTINNIEEYLENVKGKQGTQSYSSLIKEYRETFLNIDMMVINNLSDLFMNIWTGGYPF